MCLALRFPPLAAAALAVILGGCGPSPPSERSASRQGEAEACALEAAYEFRWAGGLAPEMDVSRVEPPDTYRLRREFLFGRETVACETTVPACGAPEGRIDVGDIRDALEHPEVAAAWTDLAGGDPPVHGRDLRPVDTPVWVIRRETDSGGGEGADGPAGAAGIIVGSPCRDDASCRPIPPGLLDLRDLMEALADQQQEAPTCAAQLER